MIDLTESCNSSSFYCGDGSCIPDYWTCDGYEDCFDLSDESNCGMNPWANETIFCRIIKIILNKIHKRNLYAIFMILLGYGSQPKANTFQMFNDKRSE